MRGSEEAMQQDRTLSVAAGNKAGFFGSQFPSGGLRRIRNPIGVAFGVLATVAAAHAGESGPSLRAPADIEGWIDGLANRNGANCCSDADGVRPQEVDWDMGKDRYRVRVDGRWLDVPDVAVVHGPNYLGHAVVWLYEDLILDDAGVELPYVRCFLPGSAS
jgi:hypothetical protein